MVCSRVGCGIVTLVWLVSVVPAWGDTREGHTSFRLVEGSAAVLIEPLTVTGPAWSVENPRSLSIRPVQHMAPEPRVTSVPVAAIVGGVLLASLGISQRIRRTRALEA
jgi:hypothetical protein